MQEKERDNMKNDSFGINVKQWCREHETMVTAAKATPELLREHEKKINWLQHERLVHLIVTFMVVVVEMVALVLTVLHPELGVIPTLVMILLAVLLGFYFWHYFFLENTVQRWYRIADELTDELETAGKGR